MSRLPFDPGQMSGPPPAPPPQPPLSVSALAAMIDSALRTSLPSRICVVGEITGLATRTHWYFRLADDAAPAGAEAIIDCVMFSSTARRVAFEPRNGQRVLLTGRVEFYPRQGRTQFYAERMEAVGAGDLDQRLKALLAAVRELGWLEPARKRPIPVFPRAVAVITSRSGAALQDVLDTMRRRSCAVDVFILDVRVQGDGSPAQVAAALNWVSRNHAQHGIDAVIVTRGGGSAEDLWAFNEKIVAQAIVQCAVPVVAAIGHETDTTIAELVADERAATPTQAAMRVTPDAPALLEQLDLSRNRIAAAMSRRLQRASLALDAMAKRRSLMDAGGLLAAPLRRVLSLRRALQDSAARKLSAGAIRLERANARLQRARPEAVHALRSARWEELARRLRRAMRERLSRSLAPDVESRLRRGLEFSFSVRSQRLDALERELIVTSPAHVLSRGYSVTTGPDGRVVRDAGSIASGEIVSTRLAVGGFRSTVIGASDAAAAASPGPAPAVPARRNDPPARRRRPRDDGNQMGLFGGGARGD